MNWINDGIDRNTTLAPLPKVADRFQALYDSFWNQAHLAPSTLELCRLRLAQLHRSDADWSRVDCEIDADKREHLAAWSSHEGFSDAERACLEFTEVYAMDVQAISDELAEAVKTHYGDAGLVTLVEALGIFDGMTRLSLLWQLPAPRTTPENRAGDRA